MLTREPKEWRDKTILAANTQALTGIDYTVGGATTSFERDSAGWATSGHRANIESLNPALTALMGLKADDFIDSSVAFKSRPLTVELKGPDAVTLSLYPLDAESSRYAVRTSKSPQLFVLGKYAAGQLLRPLDRSGAAAPPPRQVAAVPHEEKKQPAPVAVQKPPAAAPVTTQPARIPVPKTAEKKPTTSPQEQKSVTPPPQQQQAKKAPAQQQQAAPAPPPARTTQPATPPVKEPAKAAAKDAGQSASSADDEGELTIHTVKKGETMTTIAKKYNVTVDQIIKWNQLKSISVRPGMELYVFVKK
jgi:LysM repeat protein